MAADTTDTKKDEVVEQYPLEHKGFGKYEVGGTGKTFPSKAEAEAYRQQLLEQATFEGDYGDIVPDGITIHDNSLVFRGSVLEVPMNELFLPDGSYNPMYDRAWYYGWGADTGTDISDKQAKGYHLFLWEELDQMVEQGTAPAHYRSLLQRKGDRLLYGDAVLMRIPRIRWRQLQQAKHEAAIRRIKRTDDAQREAADKIGMKPAGVNMRNELTIRMS